MVVRTFDYNQPANPIDEVNLELTSFPYFDRITDDGTFRHYSVETTLQAVQGGQVWLIPPFGWTLGYSTDRYTLTSLTIADSAGMIPVPCLVPGVPVVPPTPTPEPPPPATATGTPPTATATNTATATPTGPTQTPLPSSTPSRTPTATAAAGTATATATPWPTSAGGTPQVAPSPTPYTYIVVTPILATRIALPTLASLELPSIVVPTLANPAIPTPLPGSTSVASVTLVSGTAVPNSTAIAQVGNYSYALEEVLTAYESDLEEAETILAERFTENVIYVERQVQYLEFPVRLVRAMQAYMPNLWPVVLTMFYSVLLMFLTSAVQIGTVVFSLVVRAGSWFMGWLFRLWEAIPFIN